MNIPISGSRQLPIAALVEGANPWRGKTPSTADLQESLRRAPMLHPVVVRQVPGKRNRWELISGYRRLAAARALGHSHIEVRVVAVDEVQREQLQLEENVRRQTLGRQESAALARLLKLYEQLYPKRPGRPRKGGPRDRISSLQALSRAVGRSPRELRRQARVGSASAEIRRLYESGRVTLKQAEALATGSLKLLTLKKTDGHQRGLDALRYAVKQFSAGRVPTPVRRQALPLLAELQGLLR
jgi:ParB family chromosome partitioning protein